MTAFDYAVLGVVGISVVISVMRGAVREVLSLGSWILAFWLGSTYTPQLAPVLPSDIPTDALRLLAAFLIIFLGTLLLMALVSIAVSELIKMLGLGTVDRMLGAVFGVARALVVILVVVLLAGLTKLPQQPVWKHAMFSPPLEAAALKLKVWLPPAMADKIRYD